MALDHHRLIRSGKNQAEFFAFDMFTSQIVPTDLLYFLYIKSEVKQYYEALYLSYKPRKECNISQLFKTNCTHSIFRTIDACVGFELNRSKSFQNHLYGQPVITFAVRDAVSYTHLTLPTNREV